MVTHHFEKSSKISNTKKLDYDDPAVKFEIGGVLLLYMAIGAILFTLLLILPIKYLTARTRPTRVPSVRRYINMRKREGNQPAHPSGDAAIAAFFFSLYFFVF